VIVISRFDMVSSVCLLLLAARVASRLELSKCDIVECDVRSYLLNIVMLHWFVEQFLGRVRLIRNELV